MTSSSYHRLSITINRITWSYLQYPNPEKPPLFLLHGLGNNAELLVPLAETLKDDFEIIIPDLPGFGETQGSLSRDTFHSVAEEVIALIKELGYDHVSLFGVSSGGSVAINVATMNPSLINTLFLNSPIWRPQSLLVDSLAKIQLFIAKSPKILQKAIQKKSNISLLLKILKRCQQFPVSLEPYFSLITKSLSQINIPVAAHLFQSLKTESLEKELLKIQSSTLIIFGDQDRIVPESEMQALANLLPHSRFDVISEEGHNMILTAPNKIAQTINTFQKQRRSKSN